MTFNLFTLFEFCFWIWNQHKNLHIYYPYWQFEHFLFFSKIFYTDSKLEEEMKKIWTNEQFFG